MRVFIALLFSLSLSFGQSYVHDPSLDDLKGGVANVDASINGYMGGYGQWLTVSNVSYSSQGSLNLLLSNIPTQYVPVALTNGLLISNTYSSQFTFALVSTNWAASGTNNPSAYSNSIINLGTFNGHTFSMDLGLRTGNYISTSFCSLVRGVLISITWLGYFILALKAVQTNIIEVLNHQQTRPATTSAFGFNVGFLTGPIMTAVILAAIGTAIGYIATRGFTGDAFNKSQTAFTFMKTEGPQIAAWEVLTAMCPIADVFGAFITWVIFRYIVMFPAWVVVRGFIRAIAF